MAEDLHHLAGLLHPYSINRVRETLLGWLRNAHDEALGQREAGAHGTLRFVADRHRHLVGTARSLRDHLAELQADPDSLLLTIKQTGVLLYPFHVHPGPHDPLPIPDLAYTRSFLAGWRQSLDDRRLVLLPWADLEGLGHARLWAGVGTLDGDRVDWSWLVPLANEIEDIPLRATYPSRAPDVEPPRDADTEEYYDHLADDL